ncbi:hypothetical protein [Mediterraneibacter gnavus]|uniref:hypothetical protein n=1 Tax=Mediterraneibacter gnavus TaxID=33038 RepID=UPI002331104F|nr:hypothetical protein [Mediterraneibacter gnavus]MDB8681538.1 hypothetical protein [Mediterraneibacter gnavus]MDB8692640.1 hypothetical protein [Mediterraneibacter gnavus]
MRKIVVDMQNFLFADSVATAFRSSGYDIDVIRTESPKDTLELCQVYKPYVLIMEVTSYTPWKLDERLNLREQVKAVCPECKIALIVDANTERQAAKDIRDAKKNGLIDQFFYGSMTAEYLMDQIYAM